MNDTILLFLREMSDSTIKRKVNEEIWSIADMLKLWGFFGKETKL